MGKPEPGAQLLPRAWGKAHAEMRQPLTVCSSAFNATISSIDFKDRNWFVLSAILLKQWRVPSTLKFGLPFDKILHLFNRVRGVQIFGAVFEIAGPVFHFRVWKPGKERRD